MPALAPLALAAALVPFLFGFLLPRLARLPAPLARRLGLASALAALGLAAACAVLWAIGGPVSHAFFWLGSESGLRVSVGTHVDGLTVVMLGTVTLIGAVVTRFALRYLDGDPGQARFSGWLAYTLSAVLLLVVSSNLLMLFAAWVGTSHGLHQLLTYYGDRPAAQLVARKKFLTSRIGDALLLIAFLLLYGVFGSFEFTEIFPRSAELTGDAHGATAAAVGALLVLGAMTKSAQFPFHTWLPDTMETPTPVSALMHAGIINAGGFLLIRMSPIVAATPGALFLLASAGAFTAVFASVVMLTQTDIKRKLAYSTVAQMGFMMLQCGLGAFSAAALHLVGHSFYKGHAFLSAASTVNPHVPQPGVASERAGRVAGVDGVLALLAGVGLVTIIGWVLGVDPRAKVGLPVLGAILAMAVSQLLLTAHQTDPGSRRALAAALRHGAAIALAYFALAALFERLLAGALPTGTRPPAFAPALTAFVLALFGIAIALQAWLPRLGESETGRRLYVHAYNGFYLGTLQNRLVQRIWPVRTR